MYLNILKVTDRAEKLKDINQMQKNQTYDVSFVRCGRSST